MTTITKLYNTAAGELIFDFIYDDSIASISDFDIVGLSNLSYGYDSENNLDIASYPSNITITIDAFNGDNYKAFRTLYENYNINYPANISNVFLINFWVNSQLKLKAGIYGIKDTANEYEIEVTFIDNINLLKDFSIANPAILNELYQNGIIPRSQVVYAGQPMPVYAYGFGGIHYSDILFPPRFFVTNINEGDKDTNLKKVIEYLFKLLNPDLLLDLQNQFEFRDITVGSPSVTINNVNLRRVLSNLFGRYVVFDKSIPHEIGLHRISGSENYTDPNNFEVVFESEQYKVYWHNYNGTSNTGTSVLNKWEKGVEERTIAGILKIIAKNLFSYYGIKNPYQVFFRHRRYKSEVHRVLTQDDIIDMEKVLTVDQVQGVKIDDYYTGNYGTDGSDYDTNNIPTITYKIPFNAFRTDTGGWEYRLNYYVGGAEKRVIYFNDLENEFEDIPQEVISRAEWNAHKTFRDKYNITIDGIDIEFDKTYQINYKNYQCKVRIITMEQDFISNETNITAMEIDNE